MEVCLSRKPTTIRLCSLQLASETSFVRLTSGDPSLGDRDDNLRSVPRESGPTLTTVRDLPHSKQHSFNRDVINPQDGHILCVPYPAIRGFSLRILWSSRTVNK